MAKRDKLTTPKGVFKFCHLNQPDHKGAERFGGDPMYKVTLLLEKDDPKVQTFLAEVAKRHAKALEDAEEKMDEANGKAKAAWKKKGITEPTLNDFYDEEADEDGNPTGRIEMRFKTHATYKDRQTGKLKNKSIPFVDGKGVVIPWKKRPLVFGGTEGRVSFTTSSAFVPKDADAYLSMWLGSVQITKLETAGGGSDFGADEDSDFSADELEEYEGNANDDDDGDGDPLDDDGDPLGDEGSSGGAGGDDLDDEIPF